MATSTRFSGILQLTNLDDFITPSQECIIPVETVKQDKTGLGVKIQVEDDGSYMQLQNDGVKNPLAKVGITLNDCLACSGCITSAESVLISQQNHLELMRILQENTIEQKHIVVVTLSLQPVLSIAEGAGLSPHEAAQRLAGFFKSHGVTLVMDLSIAEEICLLEEQEELFRRIENSKTGNSKKTTPMLSSACPGWICYAEKTHGPLILPYLSPTKSPQQIMGSLIKYHLAPKMGWNVESVYHVTVMPCYDKKLEASRSQFESNGIKEVDCVVTPVELSELFASGGLILSSIPISPLDFPFEEGRDGLVRHPGSGSGGWAHHVYAQAANQLQQGQMEFKTLKNPDLMEAVLEKDGQVSIRIAIANGFKNIQNLVQRIKRGKCPYDYVEIMACPKGCLNGGAQLRSKEGILSISDDFNSLPMRIPNDSPAALYLKGWLQDNQLLHTTFKAIEKPASALAIRW